MESSCQKPTIASFIESAIAHYNTIEEVLILKMPGVGSEGYLALVVEDTKSFIEKHPEAFEFNISVNNYANSYSFAHIAVKSVKERSE